MDWIEVNRTSLRYDLRGAGERVLVLVHEMGGTLESWDQVLPILASERRVLRYDTRGAGMSEKIRTSVTFDVMVEDLAPLLDGLGISQPIALAGCAVGGGIVLHFATRFPQSVAALIAMRPATGVAPERPESTLKRTEAIAHLGPAGVIEESLAASYPPEVCHDPEQYRRFRARWLGNDPESYAAIYPMLVDATIEQELPRITIPALLLAGLHDKLRLPSMVEALARAIPDARFQTLETGHFMAVQTPGPVADAMRAFLEEVGA
jgi:3-oxoadipate enol-lactonase